MRDKLANLFPWMRDRLVSLFWCVVVFGGLLACIWAYKGHSWVSVEPDDRSMLPLYPEGTYLLEPMPQTVKDLRPGRVYAFRAPGEATQCRLAWLVATEGQVVVRREGELLVDGVKSTADLRYKPAGQGGFMVPQGCVYMLQSAPERETDSLKYGVIPFRNLMGKR